jgi:hypothetical protein
MDFKLFKHLAEQCHLQIEGNYFSTKIVRQAWTSTVEMGMASGHAMLKHRNTYERCE